MASLEQTSADIVINAVSNGNFSQRTEETYSEKDSAKVNSQTGTTTTTTNGQTTTDEVANDKSNVTTKETIKSNLNGNANDSCATNNNNKSNIETLQIIGHIKNIEKINEKRRIFLTNTLSETVITTSSSTTTPCGEATETQATITTKNATTAATTCEKHDAKTDNDAWGDVVQRHKEEFTVTNETYVDKSNGFNNQKPTRNTLSATLPPLKSPQSPPPKPPMLSRTRSLGIGDQRTSSVCVMATEPETPTNTPRSSLPSSQPSSSNVTQIGGATITATTTAMPAQVTSVSLPADTTASNPRRPARPMSISPDSAAAKQISVNHYDRLIEELKCPGCASPMKAPILLCQTGHSICSQCTRVLMLCPLCKEPFTNMRCRTIEALCAKAHFRCCNAVGGCTVRLQTDLLGWHEKQCIYKPMKCFMGRVWGDCQWSGREAYWKDHLESDHGNKLFKSHYADLIWDMGVQQKPLTGYYVFDIYDELFNFYEIYDRDRVLFTMTCTSTMKERKHNFAYEVTIIHPDCEALAITQKFPVHSEYDKDILADGTCVSIALSDLAKFVDGEKLLHYHVRLLEVKTPRKLKSPRYIAVVQTNGMHPVDFQQTQIEGVNLKGVPVEKIVTRKLDDVPFVDNQVVTPSSIGTEVEAGAVGLDDEDANLRRRYYGNEAITRDSSSEDDPELEAYIAKKWGTPQLHFNRKFLKNNSVESSSSGGDGKRAELADRMDDKLSISSRSTSYTKRMTNSLRKSFRSLKTPLVELRPFPFVKRHSPEKKSA